MFRKIGILFVLSLHLQAKSQDAEVRRVIDDLFSAMYNADASGLRKVFHDSARLGSVSMDAAGNTVVKYADISGFISYVGKLEKGVADERFTITDIRIDGKMASAWVPYNFYRAGSFSHCGVNHMLLTMGKDGWKVLTITDTRRKDGCL
jgi:hypothetical protein